MDRVLNAIESRNTDRDFSFEDIVTAAEGEEILLPSKFTITSLDTFKIRDQGQTGSCVGQAISSLLTMKSGNTKNFSPFFIWQSAKEVDDFTTYPTTFIEGEGTSSKAALDVVRKWGAVTEEQFEALRKTTASRFYAEASKEKIKSYTNLGLGLTEWKKWLVNYNSPIVACLFVDDAFYRAGTTKILNNTGMIYGGHCILIAGYDETQHAFLIVNSWGEGWGNKGKAYADIDYIRNRFFMSNYGVI